MSVGTAASAKVWRRIGTLARDALLKGLTPLELRSVLADIARARASEMQPADLIKRWREDRFLTPRPAEPLVLLPILMTLWQEMPSEFVPLEMSPLTPLGSAAQLSGYGQNRVVSSMRGTEVVSDAVHPLALEASRRRRGGVARVHLATASRVAHAWDHEPDAPAHEHRLTLCSSAPDGGGLSTEADLLELHLNYWRTVLDEVVPDGKLDLVVWDATLAALLADRGHTDVNVAGRDKTPWRNPYHTAGFRLTTIEDGDELVLGDGGFVQWTQALTRNRKDRCLVSSISIDELVALSTD